MTLRTALVLVFIPLSGCLIASADSAELSKADECRQSLTKEGIEGSEWVNTSGTLRWIDVEGGFWGIETDDGRRLQPIGDVCEDLAEDGLRVRVEGRTRPDMGGIHMWGEYVDLALLARA